MSFSNIKSMVMATVQEARNMLLLPERRRITALQNKPITEQEWMDGLIKQEEHKEGLHRLCSELQAGNE